MQYDRWPDVLFRRLRAAFGTRISLVNEGIGGNRVVSDAGAGGPSALSRLERDVFNLSGIGAVVWLEGINDLSAGTTADAVIAGIQEGARRIHGRGLRMIQATITSALGNNPDPKFDVDRDNRRKTVNAFIRSAGIFDSVADFDRVTVDPSTGQQVRAVVRCRWRSRARRFRRWWARCLTLPSRSSVSAARWQVQTQEA